MPTAEEGKRERRRRRVPSGPRVTVSQSAAGAFGWGLMNTVIGRLGTVGIGIALARVLGPEAFGTYAVAQVALLAVLSCNELGVSLAIVRWPGDPRQIVGTVTTISLVMSMGLCLAGLAAAPIFAAGMGDPQATPVVRLMITSVVINGLVAAPAALLQREFRERARMVIDQANTWVGAITSIVLALCGMGAMALAVGRVAGSVVSAVMFLLASPVPFRLGWDRTSAGPLLKFGAPLAGTSIIVFGVGYSDQLVAGSQLGTTALGFYLLAFNLSSWPVSVLSQPLRRVAPAAFAQIQRDTEALRLLFARVAGVLAAVAVPIFLGLAATSVSIVTFVYGEPWRPAAQALIWLLVAALGKVFAELCYDFLVVVRRTGAVFVIQALTVVVLWPALVVGARIGGLAGLATAQAAVMTLVVLPLYGWQLRRLAVGTRILVRECWLPVVAGVAVGAAGRLLGLTGLTSFGVLALTGGLSAAAVLILAYVRRDVIRDLRRIGRPESEEDIR